MNLPLEPLRHAFTVDVEDYFHVSAFARSVRFADWEYFESRVVANTHRVLGLLSRHEVRGTFFVLGWVAERWPQLVRDIQQDGHEIGCHSYAHQLLYDLGPERFRDDLIRGRDILADITGEAVRLYRAPSFSITRQSLWALEILTEEGFTVDSSIYPIRHDRYGIPTADSRPHRIATSSGLLWEFPGTCRQWGRFRLPAGGGGYLRLLPFAWTTRCLLHIERVERRPFSVYVHPWELDPEQPRLPGPRLSRLRHYCNLHRTESRLSALLSRFRFTTLSEVLDEVSPTHGPTYTWADTVAGLYAPPKSKDSSAFQPVLR